MCLSEQSSSAEAGGMAAVRGNDRMGAPLVGKACRGRISPYQVYVDFQAAAQQSQVPAFPKSMTPEE